MNELNFDATSKQSAIKYIESKIIPEPMSGCWLWGGTISSSGYGIASFRKKNLQAHRVSFSAFKTNPDEMLVCHKCDTKACVNPDHLFVGTSEDNLNDCYSKNRRGKLTRSQISCLVKSRGSLSEIAKRFNVTRGAVCYWNRIERKRSQNEC